MEFLGYYGPELKRRAIVATTDPRTRPPVSTWYLATNLTVADAPLAEVVRLYGLRNWIEDHYKRIKDELGWADLRGALGPRYPPTLDAGELRVLILLVA